MAMNKHPLEMSLTEYEDGENPFQTALTATTVFYSTMVNTK